MRRNIHLTRIRTWGAPATVALVALLFACPVIGEEDTPPPPKTEPTSADEVPPPGEQADAQEAPDDNATGETPAEDSGDEQATSDEADATPRATPVELKGAVPSVDDLTTNGTAAKTSQTPFTPLAEEAPKKPGKKRKRGFSGFLEKYDLFQGVNISGQNTLTLQEHSIEGSQSTFQSQRWDTDSLMRQSSLHLEGPMWKEFVFQADISDTGMGPRYSRWVAGYMGHDTALLYGDLDLRLGGNEFVGFRKSTKGWQVDQRLPAGGFMRGFLVREKGVTRNQTFVGNDTPGPYFLTFTPVIEGSEVVKVNEQFMKFGKDYRLDYDSGQLWFEPIDGQPRIITAADTISVSYQSLGYLNQGPGEIYGVRAEWPLMNDRLLVGLTTLQQDRVGAGKLYDTVGYQEDVYYGSGSTGPFDTSFRPIIPDGTSVVYKGERQIIDNALVVLVDGTEQVEGADYDSYRAIGRVIFRRAVPPTALVIVRYYYSIDSNMPSADHSMWGVDLAYQLTDDINVAMDWAASSGGTSGKDGDALSTTLNYTRDRLRLVAEYRAIDPTYSYMDTVGFRRREKGLNIGGEWQVSDNISISDRYSSLDTDSGQSFGYSGYGGGSNFGSGVDTFAMTAQSSTPTSLSVGAKRNDLSVRFDFDGWPDLSYQRSTMSNEGGSGGASDYTTDSIQMSYAPGGGKYTVRSSLSRSTQENLGRASTTSDELTLRGSKSDQFQTSVTYNPMDSLSLAASLAANSSSAIESVNSSSSENIQLSARWTPSTSLSTEFSRTMSTTDGRVSSGFFGGYPIGSTTPDGGTYSPGGGYLPPGSGSGGEEPDDATTSRPSSDDSSDRLAINWRPSEEVSCDFSIGRRKYQSTGAQGYLADSDQDFWNLGAMWQASDALSLNLSVGADNMQFLDEDRGAVKNKSYILGASYRPPGKKWSTGLTLNLQDGSSPTYVGFGRLQRYKTVPTKLFDISGQFSYNIRQDLSLQASAGISDFAGGYADFRKHNAELRMRYQLSGTTGLDFGYRFIKNISRTGDESLVYGTSGSGQNYIANTFLLTLSTSFRGGIGGGKTGGLGPGYGMGAGFGGGPGTFGGYQPGLRTPGYGSQTPYGGGYGQSYTGVGSGFGTGTGTSHQTGYGPSQFDSLGSTNVQRQPSQIFGPGSPWGPTTSTVRRTTSGGDITKGIGDFRKQERTDAKFGTDLALDVTRPPGAERGAAAGQEALTGALEDWWLLGDNMSSW